MPAIKSRKIQIDQIHSRRHFLLRKVPERSIRDLQPRSRATSLLKIGASCSGVNSAFGSLSGAGSVSCCCCRCRPGGAVAHVGVDLGIGPGAIPAFIAGRTGSRTGKFASVKAGGAFLLFGWLDVDAFLRIAINSARFGHAFELARCPPSQLAHFGSLLLQRFSVW